MSSSKLWVSSEFHLLCVDVLLYLPVSQIPHLIEWRVTIAPFLGALRTNSEQYPSWCVEGEGLNLVLPHTGCLTLRKFLYFFLPLHFYKMAIIIVSASWGCSEDRMSIF